ncbi:MAG: lipopolysaccharide biosynthesis protein [Sphingomonas bacterium]|nr:lipopolysaccharide biosynthesis protein [Sphingomonas bacterium]
MTAGSARRRQGPTGRATGSFGIGKLASVLRRRLGTFVGVATGMMALTLLYAAAQVPLYRATAEVVTESEAAGAAVAEPQALRSRDLARNVATALRLDGDAEFLSPARTPMQRLIGAIGAGSTSAGSGPPIERAIDALIAGVSIESPDDTLSLLIGFTARSPEDAARIANEYARQFVRRQSTGGADLGSGARILSDAQPPETPITSSPLLSVAAGLLLALLAGLVAALLRERAFGGITTGDEIEGRTGLHNLGTVPLLVSVGGDASAPADAIVDAPRSGFAEALRSLRTAARIAGGEDAQVVAITSAARGAGTSTLAACLVRTVALAGESVVLIAPEGGAAFDLAGREQAPEPITGDASLDGLLIRDAASGACVIRGTAVDEALVRALRPHFAWIAIDAPAVTDGGDAAVARVADLVLVAVRWRSTPARAIRRLADRLAESGTPAFAVLTQVDMRRQVKFVHGDIANYYGRLSKYYS